MRHSLTVILYLVCCSVLASATEGNIRGRVTDSEHGEALAGVYVIYGSNRGTVTDESGQYFIANVSGRIRVIFQFVGYATVTRDVMVSQDETIELDISLETLISEIDQVVVSANRTEQKIAELSVSMSVIKNSFLSENHISDARELIGKNPGIDVMDGQASVRGGSGFSYGAGSRVLALIDGLPFNSADAGNIKWQFLPLENLSRIEIIKGASSVLYGSSALNGIINFRSADASNIPLTKFHAGTGIFGRPRNRDWKWWNTPRVFTNFSLSHLQKFGKTDIGMSAYFMTDEGYRRLNGENLGRLSLRLKHFSNKVEGLNYGMNINAGSTHKTDFVLWENAQTGALRQSETTAAEFRGSFITIDPFISLKKNERTRHDLKIRFRSDRNRLPNNEKNNSDAMNLYSEYQLWCRITDFLDITSGLTENYSVVNSEFFGDHYGLNLAGFSQVEIRPLSRLKAVAGLRLEHFSLDGISDRLTPILRAGVNFQAAEFTYLRASFGQGYRFPSIAEKYASTTLGSVKIIPNPDILAEKGWNTELGIKQAFLWGNMTGQADLSIFLMRNSNLIEFLFASYPGEGVGFRADNLEQARIWGSELEFAFETRISRVNISATGGYAYTFPGDISNRHSNETVFLKYRRKHTAKIYVNSAWKSFTLGSGLNVRSKILNIDDVFLNPATSELFLPGFYDYWNKNNIAHAVLDVSAGYIISPKLTLSFVIKNLTNTEYMGRPGDIQPHRNFSIRLSGRL
ncbi:MAG: TonB-dependent receptor [Bacteroidales bacterium]|nr:TonB-dependent receptor [Bacteroidales bacterium]